MPPATGVFKTITKLRDSMRVLNVTGGISTNAVEQTLRRLDRYFKDYDLTCGIFESRNPEFDQGAATRNIDTRYYGSNVTDRFKSVSLLPGEGYPRAAAHAIRGRGSFDLIHVYGGPLFHGPVGMMHAVASNAPLITRFNGYVPLPETKTKRIIVKTIMRRLLNSSRVVFNSRAQRDDIIETYGGGDHVNVIPPGVDSRFYKQVSDTSDLAAELGISDGTHVIGSVMTPRPVKGLDNAFDVLAALREQTDVTYIIVGDSDYVSQYRDMAREKGVADAVYWAGYRRQEDLAEWYSLFDVTILTSEWESFGMSLTESYLCETPCIAFDVGGMSDQIVNESTGYLVEPYDTAAFAEMVGALLTDPQKRATFGERGRGYVAERFTLDRASALYGDMISSLA